MTESERELFEQLQAEMESCPTQIGRKTEQLRLVEAEILSLEKRINDIELEIEKLYAGAVSSSCTADQGQHVQDSVNYHVKSRV